MVDWIVSGLQWIWGWLLAILTSAGTAIWNGVITSIPSTGSATLDDFASYLLIANKWLPIDVAVTATATYFAFLLVFVGAKMLLKLIPGIG